MSRDTHPLVYFGKIPSRGDFIKSKSYATEIDAIDRWVSDALREDKNLFKEALTPFIYFHHVDTSVARIIAGVLLPSHDTTNRSYPIIGLSIQNNQSPKSWLSHAAMKSYNLWDNIHLTLKQAKEETDASRAIDILNQSLLPTDDPSVADYYDFINHISFTECAKLLKCDSSQLAQQLIATGLLFLPTLSKGFQGLNKFICWKLTENLSSSIKIATFWNELINGFYKPHEVIINTYLYRENGTYFMTLNFNQPDGNLLTQLINQSLKIDDMWVCIENSEWTLSYIDDDIGLNRLYKILLEDNLSLFDVRQLFKQLFLAQ